MSTIAAAAAAAAVQGINVARETDIVTVSSH